jgi:hypothetical protein
MALPIAGDGIQFNLIEFSRSSHSSLALIRRWQVDGLLNITAVTLLFVLLIHTALTGKLRILRTADW